MRLETRATTNAATDGARTANATADAARTTSRTTNTATDGTRMFGRTNVDDIGVVNKGWERAVFDGVDRFRHKKITYPEEADDVRRALEATMSGIIKGLQEEKKVTLTGFCTFSAVDKEEKQGRNPRTGAPVTIPARTDVKIKAGSKLKEALN